MNVINSRVVNIDELKLEHFAKGDKFESLGAHRAAPRREGPRLFLRCRPARKALVSFPQSSRGRGDVLHRERQRRASLRGRDTKDPRGRRDLLPDRRPGNGAPDRQRLGRRARVSVRQHDDAGGGPEFPTRRRSALTAPACATLRAQTTTSTTGWTRRSAETKITGRLRVPRAFGRQRPFLTAAPDPKPWAILLPTPNRSLNRSEAAAQFAANGCLYP